MIKFLCNLFPKNFAKHVAIVFTHYDHDYQMKINKKNLIMKNALDVVDVLSHAMMEDILQLNLILQKESQN